MKQILRRKWAAVVVVLGAVLGLAAASPAAASVDPTPTYWLVNQNSGMCMSVRDASTAQGAPVTQFPCSTNYVDQTWVLDDSVGQDPRIINVHSGLCLSVFNANLNNGGQVDQWGCSLTDSYPDQHWFHWTSGWFENDNSDRCLSVPNASRAQDVRLDQWDCGFVDQVWKLVFVRNI